MEQFTNYINTGSISGEGFRSSDPITGFYVFAHGTDGDSGNYAVEFGYHTDQSKEFQWDIGSIEKISSSAFSSNVISKFYSCRTGNHFSKDTGSFAQVWANKTGGDTFAFKGIFNGVGRSDYSNILGSKLDKAILRIESFHEIELLSIAFRNWRVNRGDVLLRPGHAWSLPQASYFTSWNKFSPSN